MNKFALVGAVMLGALGAGGFTLVSPDVKARVVVDEGEPDYVLRAAQDLTNDVKKITGAGLALVRGAPQSGDVFVATKRRGEWEAYDVAMKDGVLVVSGSDARGTIISFAMTKQVAGGRTGWRVRGTP